jgi:transposase
MKNKLENDQSRRWEREKKKSEEEWDDDAVKNRKCKKLTKHCENIRQSVLQLSLAESNNCSLFCLILLSRLRGLL